MNGKSSLGRLGLQVHATAGFVDPGFAGVIVLELSNVATLPILLRPGMKVAQMVFQRLDQAAERPYGHPELNSKYQGQRGAVASRYSLNDARRLNPDAARSAGGEAHPVAEERTVAGAAPGATRAAGRSRRPR